MKSFAIAKTGDLLAAMTAALEAAAREPHADAVHDLRVSIRRLQQALRIFRQYFAKQGVKRIRKQMKRIMDHAGEVRNCDICIELVSGAQRSIPQLSERRAAAQEALSGTLADIQAPGLHDRWRRALGIEGS